MIPYPNIDPALFRFGPFEIRWYGLMYVVGFLAAYLLIPRQKRAQVLGLDGRGLQDLLFYLAVGLVVGGRFGYVLFYQASNLGEYLRHPLEIIAVWHGGMSFHGGLIGAMLAGVLFSQRRKLPFWDLADLTITVVPIGLGLGRLGNFINGELFGRPTDLPWGMVFPGGGPLPRHPSQLYEAFLEGACLFLFLWGMRDRPFRPGAMVCLFLGGYGVARFAVEFFREPDPQIGLLWGFLSMGQVLSIAMMLVSSILWAMILRKRVQ